MPRGPDKRRTRRRVSAGKVRKTPTPRRLAALRKRRESDERRRKSDERRRSGPAEGRVEEASSGRQAKPFLSSTEIDRIVTENRRLKQLHEIINFLNTAESLDQLIIDVVELAMKVARLSRGVIMTADGPEGRPRIRLLRGWLKADRSSRDFAVVQHLLADTAEDGRPRFITDISEDRRFERFASELDIRTLYALPLKLRDKVIGVVALADEVQLPELTDGERDLLVSFANHAGHSYARLTDDVERRKASLRLARSHSKLRERLDDCERSLSKRESAISYEGSSLKEAKHQFYREYLKSCLSRHNGSVTAAAREARISKDKFKKLLERYGLRTTSARKAAGRAS